MISIATPLLEQWAVRMNYWTMVKDSLTFIVACIAAFFTIRGYLSNAKTRRAEFICDFYKSFFEEATYKHMREELDTDDSQLVNAIVQDQREELTDYLNFFELVAYLQKRGNLSLEDVRALLGYYLDKLTDHTSLRVYIGDHKNGFEELHHLLDTIEKMKSKEGTSS